MQNYPQQTSNPFQAFPWMNFLLPQGQNAGQLYAGNPFLNMYTPAPNPSALTATSVMPPAGPGGGGAGATQIGPPPTSSTLTPTSAAPGGPPQAQTTPALSAGTVPGIPGAGGTGLPAAPAPPLPPAQYVAQQQAAQQPAGSAATPSPVGVPFQQGILQSMGYQAGPAAYYPASGGNPLNLSGYLFPTTPGSTGQVYDTATGQFVTNWAQTAPQAAAGAIPGPIPGTAREPSQQR